MTDPTRGTSRNVGADDGPDTRAEVDPDVADLLGLRPAGAGDIPSAAEVDDLGEMTDTAMDEGELESREPGSDQPDEVKLETLTADEARAGETVDPEEAAEEGLTWIPPTDPPVIPGSGTDDVTVAAGFGATADEEPFDADHHGEPLTDGDERTARVEEALRADARTSAFADRIEVETDGPRVILSGQVTELDDEDEAIAVAEDVPGVREVVSQIEVEALEATEPERD
jgi:hypothetical protein